MTVTAKLTTLNTTEDPRLVEEDNIVAFIDVLKCSRKEATFYLESSAWNIETAVLLWIENNPSPYQTYNPWGSDLAASSHSHYNHALLNASSYSQSSFMTSASKHPSRQWYSREVLIEDFPQDWSARVSRSSGQIYFVHLPTGKRQYCVPPGYADRRTDVPPYEMVDTKTEVAMDDYPTKLSPDKGPQEYDHSSLSTLFVNSYRDNMLIGEGLSATDSSMLVDNIAKSNHFIPIDNLHCFTKHEGSEVEDMMEYASRSNASSTRALQDENSVYTITNDLDRPTSDVMHNSSDHSNYSNYRHGKESIAIEANDGSVESSLDAYFAASESNNSSISNK